MVPHCACSIKENSYLGYQLLAALCKADVTYFHVSSGCFAVCLHLPSTSLSALFSLFIDQQQLAEFSYAEAPRHAADK